VAGVDEMIAADQRPLDITVLICTRNRRRLLNETLDSLAEMAVPAEWRCEVLVVDNHSTDDTRQSVLDRVAGYPLPLRYLDEPVPGKSNAMNTGIAAANAIVLACTDDDVRVSHGWLKAACGPLLERHHMYAYTGGPVHPIWSGPCPDWFPRAPSNLWGTIAILDYGPERFVFEDQHKVPLGANFAIRRDMIERVGGFVPSLGRSTTRTMLGQELPELFRRARAAGARGLYVPTMDVLHHIPAGRLTPSYCHRWWFGKGVSRARVDRMHPLTELGVDLRRTPHVARVPRFMFRDLLHDLWQWTRALVRRDRTEQVSVESRICYFLGYAWERQRERWQSVELQAGPPIIAPRAHPALK
jgi:cellulose synthase/poly-beta-1,6-N-acetylglucosamine synthase-like glycosyltransferase